MAAPAALGTSAALQASALAGSGGMGVPAALGALPAVHVPSPFAHTRAQSLSHSDSVIVVPSLPARGTRFSVSISGALRLLSLVLAVVLAWLLRLG